MRYILLFCLLFPLAPIQAQDFAWWNSIHNWDGITPWNQYMTISSAFMGPNALPVPELKNGRVDSAASVRISFDRFNGKGDQTQNIFLRGILPLYANRMSLELEVVPLEWYEMDTITRDQRAARTKSGKGSSGGDIYLATTIQLLKNRFHLPDIQLRMALKSASGTRLSDARFSDAPGYFFDFSFGKDLYHSTSRLRSIRWFLDVGFYSYQTFQLKNLQNDCLLFGGGLSATGKRFFFSAQIAGYAGYLNNGDHPFVFRSELRSLGKTADAAFSWQKGLNDYPYDLYRVSLIVHVPAKELFRD